MSGYTKEQQQLDKQMIDATIGALGARTIGEKKQLCENFLGDYIRVSRFWAEKRCYNPRKQMETLNMFIDLARTPQISAFKLEEYEKLLKETRRMILAKIFFRKKAVEQCSEPENHREGCVCLAMKKRVGKTLGRYNFND